MGNTFLWIAIWLLSFTVGSFACCFPLCCKCNFLCYISYTFRCCCSCCTCCCCCVWKYERVVQWVVAEVSLTPTSLLKKDWSKQSKISNTGSQIPNRASKIQDSKNSKNWNEMYSFVWSECVLLYFKSDGTQGNSLHIDFEEKTFVKGTARINDDEIAIISK